jgi:hypothetical protein
MAAGYGKSVRLTVKQRTFRVPGIDLMISTCGQESSWMVLVLARIFQKFLSVSVGKCATMFSRPGGLADQHGYKKLIVNCSSGGNLSRCADLRANFLSDFVRPLFLLDAPTKLPHGFQ